MSRTACAGSARNSRRISPPVRCICPRIGSAEQGEVRPRTQRLPQYLPQRPTTQGDIQRHSAKERVGQTGMWRQRPTLPDTSDWVSKPAGCRFDSCPTCLRTGKSCGLLPRALKPILRALTPFDPNAAYHSLTTYTRLAIGVRSTSATSGLCPVNSPLVAHLVICGLVLGTGHTWQERFSSAVKFRACPSVGTSSRPESLAAHTTQSRTPSPRKSVWRRALAESRRPALREHSQCSGRARPH
jgi:hypothetical protein